MKYIIKKIFSMMITLVVVSFCVFLAFNIIPGDPALRRLGTEASIELIEQTREQMGLNDPLLVRYARWFVNFLHGDMGTSYNYSVPVAGMILNKIPITFTMAMMSFFLTVVVSIPIGIFTAKHENGALDRAITVVNQLFMAVPPFFSGIIITFVFGMILRLFTPGGFVSYTDNFGGFIR
nr:ABC transporter permease [Butyrivibrio sp.]